MRLPSFALPIMFGGGLRWFSFRMEGPATSDLHAVASIWDSQIFKLMAAACILLVAGIVTAAWMLLINLRSDQIAKADRDLEGVAMLLAEQIDRSIQSIEFIQSDVIDRIQNLGINSPAELKQKMSDFGTYQRLKDQIAALPHIDAVVLTTPGGQLVNFSRVWPPPPLNDDQRDRLRFFHRSIAASFVDSPLFSPFNGARVLPIVRRVTSSNGALIGLLIGTIRLRYFEQLFRSVSRNHDRSIALLTPRGALIARYPRNDRLRGHTFADAAMFKDVLSKHNYGTVEQRGVENGKDLLVSGRLLTHYPLAVVVTRRVDDVLAGWWYSAIYIAGAALIIALMIAAVAALLWRVIAARLRAQNGHLDAALNNMSQGLTMFDGGGRLIVCNDRFLEIFKFPRGAVKPGCTLAELIHQRVAAGTFDPRTMGDPQAYADNVTKQITAGKPVTLTSELDNGRTVAIANRPMPGGGWVATHDDITESRRQATSFQLLFDRNPLPMWLYELPSFRFLAVNEAALAHYGYSREQFMAMTAFDLRLPDELPRFREFLDTFSGTDNEERVWRHRKADGTILDVAGYARSLMYQGRRACIVAVQDITQRKLAEEQLRRTKKFLDAIIEHVPMPILVKNVPSATLDVNACRYTLINRAAEDLFGISRDQMIGKTVTEFYPKERADFILAQNKEVLASEQPLILPDHPVHTPANGVRIAAAHSVAIRNDNDEPEYLLTVLHDMTERKRTEQRIARMAHFDNLTDLPNRITFNDTLEATIERAKASREPFTILSLDLDGFKDANDTYGHAIGDALLREVSRRLQTASEDAFLARIGGDEFSLIVSGGEQSATVVAERLLTTLDEEIAIEDRRVTIGATIGGALYPQDGVDAQTLMINADVALYRAKAAARGLLLFYRPEMGDEAREQRALQTDLHAAIERRELFLDYQPQETIAGETTGFEALLRWRCPKRGLVSPGTFIPVAEESGLIASIDNWVLHETCLEAASWPVPLTVAVNISPMQFHTGDFAASVHSMLIETGLPPGRLELEITEGVLIDDFSRAISILSRLKALGVRIALDDFGTGYSSLSYLHAFSFDKIKIDRTFIGDLEHNRHSMAIVRAVIDLGHSLNVPILAEGVETAEQHAILLRNGCDEVQGYLIGRPLPINAYADRLGRGSGPRAQRFG